MIDLKKRFFTLLRNYSNDEEYIAYCWLEIANNYSKPSRHYHNLEHLETMFSELENIKFLVNRWDELLLSIYYHDIIYKTTKSDNEHQSALVFEKRMQKTSFLAIDECKKQIELTKTHQLSEDDDTNILMDLDLAILGKKPHIYKTYCDAIRKEYQLYPDLIYCNGRKKVLKHMLSLDSIYKTDWFRQTYENQARENLQSELDSLDK